jgi:DNA-binding transcriptional MerR regulator/effector-binding domain-containing protein
MEPARGEHSLAIGEFAKLTHLSVKTLRHYHDVGVIVPALVDPHTGYRRYSTSQVGSAHLVRRLRALDMPLAELAKVLDASDEQVRNKEILEFLQRMDDQLAQFRSAVASLRALLSEPSDGTDVTLRHVPLTHSVARAAVVHRDEIGDWCATAFPALYNAIEQGGAHPVGHGGALYSPEFFENAAGRVVAFVPTGRRVDVTAGLESYDVPAALLAVALHRGPFEELDRTYGSLGTYVTTKGLRSAGPIREHYLVSPDDTDDFAELRTEVCWPVDPASASEGAPK